jgi:hypothetical protein
MLFGVVGGHVMPRTLLQGCFLAAAELLWSKSGLLCTCWQTKRNL